MSDLNKKMLLMGAWHLPGSRTLNLTNTGLLSTSVRYLNQWLAVHPLKDDPEAPLWTTLNEPYQALSYKTSRVRLQNKLFVSIKSHLFGIIIKMQFSFRSRFIVE